MPIYEEKICQVCECSFTPSSPTQKSCEKKECRDEVRRLAERLRYKKSILVRNVVCGICGVSFETTDTRKKYCGSEECLIKVDRINNAKVELRRNKEKRDATAKRVEERLCETGSYVDGTTIDDVRGVFDAEGYELLSSEYVNNKDSLLVSCPNGHEWEVSYHNFKDGNARCLYCYLENKKRTYDEVSLFLGSLGYELLEEDKNSTFTSRSRISYKCDKGHIRSCKLSYLDFGYRCKKCFDDSCKIPFDVVKTNIESKGFKLVSDVYENDRAKLKMVCSRGHKIKKSYRNVVHNVGCPVCRLEDTTTPFSEIKEAFEKEDYVVLSTEYDAKGKIEYICPEGHKGKVRWMDFKHGGNRCRKCFATSSRAEKEVCAFVENLGIEVIANDRSVISPKELDVYVPSKNVAIEYCGFYWHCEKTGEKPKSYHYDKMISCAEAGIRLITIFEDEWVNRRDVVESRIKNALGMSERRIFARKCKVGELSFAAANDFLSKYHLQGKSNSNKRWGLFYEGELVQVITVGNLSRAHTGKGGKFLELKRFANLPNVSVVGGASKLFKVVKEYAVENGYTHIKSYCDMRYANYAKPVYESLGFELSHFTKYTPHYVRGEERFRNQGLCKTEEERLTGKTEWELREEQGYDRIWDCGHRTYVLKL